VLASSRQLNFPLGTKDGKYRYWGFGRYEDIISSAEKTPIVLYDTGEKRAWLVPASSVMLHIAQHRHHMEPYGGLLTGVETKLKTQKLAPPNFQTCA